MLSLYEKSTNPCGRANNFWFEEGIMVPVEDADDAEDAEEESSSPGGISGSSVLK